MYQAYGTYHEKRPVWQNNKRPRWWRRRVRSGGVCFVLILSAVTAATVMLALRTSSIDHRRYDVYKNGIQAKPHADTSAPQRPANVPTQQRTPIPYDNHPSEKWESQAVLSGAIESAGHEISTIEDAVVHNNPKAKDAVHDSSVASDEKDPVTLVEDSSATLMENNVAIDKGPQPRFSPDAAEGEEIGPSVVSEDKLVEDESNESMQHLSLEQKAEKLPEFVWVPFSEAVQQEVLQGWEDEWVSNGRFDRKRWGQLQEPKVDFVYLCMLDLLPCQLIDANVSAGVNGSEQAFQQTIRPWEERSVLNDPDGKWINSHGVNRYRDWDELRYSFRSIERNAGHFLNKVKVLVNSIYENGVPVRKQSPSWLALDDPKVSQTVQVVSQEEMFEADKAVCLPTFNSLTIENQMFNTESEVDQVCCQSIAVKTPSLMFDVVLCNV